MFTTKTYACLWTPLTFFVCSLVTVATLTTTNATTVVSEFRLVKDPFYQEIEVSRGIPVILNWPSTQHPVDITIEKASVTWPYTNGSYALPDFIVSLNTTRLQTTFTVSQKFNGSLYYFCRNHKAMGVNKITILDANNYHQCNTKHRRWNTQCQFHVDNFSYASTKSWHYQHLNLNLCSNHQHSPCSNHEQQYVDPYSHLGYSPILASGRKCSESHHIIRNMVATSRFCVNYTVNASSSSDVQLLWFNLTSNKCTQST